jgi:hypothetical protein
VLRLLCLSALLTATLVACGDDDDDGSSGTDEPTGSAYYQDLADLTGRLDEENTAADQELNDAVPTADPAEIGNLFSAATLESADRLEAALDEMAALAPPEDAREAHSALLTATRAELELSRAFADTLAGLDQQEIEALSPPPEQPFIETSTDDACAALQTLADSAGADVEPCVGMFAPPA